MIPCGSIWKPEDKPLLVTPARITNLNRGEMQSIISEVFSEKCRDILMAVSSNEGLLKQLLERQEESGTQLKALGRDIEAKFLNMSANFLNRSEVPIWCSESKLSAGGNGESSPAEQTGYSSSADQFNTLTHIEEDMINAVAEAKDVVRRASKERVRKAHASYLGLLVNSQYFETGCMLVILANTVYMGFDAERRVAYAKDHLGSGSMPDTDGALVELVFFLCYSIEFVLKVLYFRLDFFRDREGKLNAFDGFLLLMNLIDIMGIAASNLMVLRIVKLVNKLVKVMRMGRVVRFCKELRVILVALMKSMRTFLWTLVCMGLGMYMIAVIFVQGVADYLENSVQPDDPEVLALKSWGNIGDAMLTQYKAVTGGAPWGPAAEAIREVGVFYFCLWLAYIGMLMLSMLRVLTGILTQHAKTAFEQDHQETIEANMWELFKAIDEDGSGTITKQEFDDHLQSKPAMEFMNSMNLNPVDFIKLLHLFDSGGDGIIDIEEFVIGCKQVRGPAKNLDMTMQGHRIEDIALHLGLGQDTLQGRMCSKMPGSAL